MGLYRTGPAQTDMEKKGTGEEEKRERERDREGGRKKRRKGKPSDKPPEGLRLWPLDGAIDAYCAADVKQG